MGSNASSFVDPPSRSRPKLRCSMRGHARTWGGGSDALASLSFLPSRIPPNIIMALSPSTDTAVGCRRGQRHWSSARADKPYFCQCSQLPADHRYSQVGTTPTPSSRPQGSEPTGVWVRLRPAYGSLAGSWWPGSGSGHMGCDPLCTYMHIRRYRCGPWNKARA